MFALSLVAPTPLGLGAWCRALGHRVSFERWHRCHESPARSSMRLEPLSAPGELNISHSHHHMRLQLLLGALIFSLSIHEAGSFAAKKAPTKKGAKAKATVRFPDLKEGKEVGFSSAEVPLSSLTRVPQKEVDMSALRLHAIRSQIQSHAGTILTSSANECP